MITEKNVDVFQYNASDTVRINQPGSVRHPNGDPITKIEMGIAEAVELYAELRATLRSTPMNVRLCERLSEIERHFSE